MLPRRTHESNEVYQLDGGNEDNDLWVTIRPPGEAPLAAGDPSEHLPSICSVWVPTEDERARIFAGENIELIVVGERQPPIAMGLTSVPLGKAPANI